LSGLAGGVIAALRFTMIPVSAANSDNLILGESNRAGRSTRLASRGPSVMKLTNTTGNVALDLRVRPGSAPLAVDSRKRVPRLNADLLDGRHAVSVATRAVTAGPATTGPACTGVSCYVLGATIEAPAAGILIIGATLDLERYGAGDDHLRCSVYVDGDLAVGGRVDVQLGDSDGGDRNQEEDCTITTWAFVERAWHNVSLRIEGVRDANTVVGNGGSLWAIWAPVDGGTGTWVP
jgi:hypothetical protein